MAKWHSGDGMASPDMTNRWPQGTQSTKIPALSLGGLIFLRFSHLLDFLPPPLACEWLGVEAVHGFLLHDVCVPQEL